MAIYKTIKPIILTLGSSGKNSVNGKGGRLGCPAIIVNNLETSTITRTSTKPLTIANGISIASDHFLFLGSTLSRRPRM